MPWFIVKRPGGETERVEIAKDHFLIGKRPTCDLPLQDPLVSREHCVVVADSRGKHFLRDLGSRNGTLVDGHKVGADVLLREGMNIAVGGVSLIFTRDSAQAEEAAPAPQAETQAEPKTSAPPPKEKPQPASRPSWEKEEPTPIELKLKIHDALIEKLDLKHEDFEKHSAEEIRAKAIGVIKGILAELRGQIPPNVKEEVLIKEIADEALGLGPIEDLLADSAIDEIMVNGWDKVYVERHGKIQKTNLRFTNNEQVLNIIRRIVAPLGRRIDESSPMVDARLKDGSRVNAIIPPLALTGPTLTIRKFSEEPFTVKDMISFGTMNDQMASFLASAVKWRQNIIISGGTGSGKTVLLNVVSAFIPSDERIVTIEDAAELKLPQDHVVSLESKPPNIRGEGAIPIRKLVINALRMRPDRIIVGECRGGEALDMLQAMNTGHDGSLTTLHANSSRDALARLETMVLMAGMDLPSRAIREQVVAAVNLIVHTARLSDGSRKVLRIDEITGIEGDVTTMQTIFEYRQRGFDAQGKVTGYFTATGVVPEFIHELKKRGIGADMLLFEPAPEDQEERKRTGR